MMKLTVVIPTLGTGGAEIQTIAQVNEIAKRGVEVQLLVLSQKEDLKDMVSGKVQHITLGIKYFEKLYKSTPFVALFSLKKIAKVINKFDPDHVIAMLPHSFLPIRLLKKFRMISSKVWIYHHSTEYIETPLTNIYRKLYKTLLVDFISSKEEYHIFISDAVKEDISNHEKVAHGFILDNAVNVPHDLNDDEIDVYLREYSLKRDQYIIFPGVLNRRKGHIFFFESAKDIIIKYNVVVVIAGYGVLEKEIKTCITKQGLEKNVIITGKLENKKLLGLMSAAYLTVIPSLIEGFGNVAIESLAVGTTVLCSDAGGLPKVISNERTGYLFKTRDPGDLRKKLERLVKNPSLIIKPDILKKEYGKKYTMQIQISRLLDILEKM